LVDDPAQRLWPVADVLPGRNDDSVVVEVGWAGRRVLLPGDLGGEAERELASHIGAADVLIVGHHGSRTSTSGDWLEAVRPGVAVISAGRDNSYGHPHPEVVQRLVDREVEVLRTDLHGTIELRLNKDRIRWRSHRMGTTWTGWSPWHTADAPARAPPLQRTAAGSHDVPTSDPQPLPRPVGVDLALHGAAHGFDDPSGSNNILPD
jgi:hypothetical protein